MMRGLDSDNISEDLIQKKINKRVERYVFTSLNKAELERIPLGSDTHSKLDIDCRFRKAFSSYDSFLLVIPLLTSSFPHRTYNLTVQTSICKLASRWLLDFLRFSYNHASVMTKYLCKILDDN